LAGGGGATDARSDEADGVDAASSLEAVESSAAGDASDRPGINR
jgi:hypothetical protein